MKGTSRPPLGHLEREVYAGSIREHAGNIFREHSGNMKGTYSENIQAASRTSGRGSTRREHSGNIFREHIQGTYSGNIFRGLIQGTYSGNIFREHIKGIQYIQVSFSRPCGRRSTYPGLSLMLNAPTRPNARAESPVHERDTSGTVVNSSSERIQGTFSEHSVNTQ
jgi:hypothetical protein